MKLSQYLAKTWTKLCGLLFGGHPVYLLQYAYKCERCEIYDVFNDHVVQSTALATAKGGVNRQWANRRRPRPTRPPRAAANQAAGEKIADLADIQAAYYREKLAMKCQQHDLFLEEHNKRMNLLDLQEQIAAEQLSRLEE